MTDTIDRFTAIKEGADDMTGKMRFAAEMREMHAVMQKAMAEIADGKLAIVDFTSTQAGRDAIYPVGTLAEQGVGVHWVTPDGGGNCFFATTEFMVALILTKQASPYRLVTGEFLIDPMNPVIHAWLEWGHGPDRIVVNVSNLKNRPLYAMRKDTYYRLNRCRRRIQRFNHGEVQRRLRDFLTKRGVKMSQVENLSDIDVRAFTKVLLSRTIHRRFLHD